MFFAGSSRAIASLGLACLAFLAGIWASLPAGISWRQVVFSYLMSSGRNPRGHFYAASGLVVSTFFLFPVARRLCYAFPATRLTRAGAALSALGIGSLTFMGTLALAVDKLGTFHDLVTAISLFGILASMFLYLSQISMRGRGGARAVAAAMAVPILGAVTYLCYAFSDPSYVDVNGKLWRSLAALEWAVVTMIAIYLFVLLLLGERCSGTTERGGGSHAAARGVFWSPILHDKTVKDRAPGLGDAADF